MKKFVLSLLAFTVCLVSFAQQTNQKVTDNKPMIAEVVPQIEDVLQLKETEHDFSKIPQGKPVYYTFDIINTGKTGLKLDDVHASCGCTTPEWSREEIAPGAIGKIKVGYNAAAEGYFEKFITVTYNSNQTKQIKIKGTVWKVPEGSAPANVSVDYLKKQSF